MASTSSQIVPLSTNSTSTPTPTPYEVFLSFRGADTRFGFTSHLYNSLFRNGIRTFIDDPELRSGEVISSRLIQAIQESKIYVIVLSENYASSTWCLNELVEIFRCFKEFGRLVIPIFYKIDPSVVRRQIGSFKAAFEKHQIHFAGEMEKLNNWRHTLQEVANISGYHVSENRHIRSEADITNEVVDRILLQIKPTTLEVATYPVGLDSRIKDITSLLTMSDGEGLTIIGIYGMGGIGKTTLAKAVFNDISSNFAGSSFLSDVREVSGSVIGLVSLQRQLICELLRKEIYTVNNVSEGIATIKERICSTKVLVIIDDLDNPDQFESLVGPFFSGSVIIVTTRKEDLLVTIGVEPRYRYMLEKLDKADSWKLFKQHAFGDKIPSDTFMNLSKEILQHAGGIPLALKVFGSNLRNQSEAEWRRFIGQLQEAVNPDILKKLMISFDALVDHTLKEMFLDIACFFVGEERENAVRILGSCYRDVEPNIDRLKSRCLITFDRTNHFTLHDLLRDMGWEIARQNSPKDEPEKHSRLSGWEDICDVLENNKGTEAIKGMVHNYSFYNDGSCRVTFDTETFKSMPKLRFLKMKDVNLTGSFEQTFRDLRWLKWFNCPLKTLPSDFFPKKLVILELPRSKITRWELTKELKNLKILDLSDSPELITTPDFSRLPCLVTVDLSSCIRLEKVDISIGSLVNLVSLDLSSCITLRSLPDSVCNLRRLESLNTGVCWGLESLPEELGNIESLTKLVVGGQHISKLPDSIGCLSKLVELRLDGNYKLETVRDVICNFRLLEILYVSKCGKLEELLPYGIYQLSNLQLPPNLKQLIVIGCRSILRLPNLSNLKHLRNLNLENCCSLIEIDSLEELISIRCLNLDGCTSIKRLPNLSNLKQLESLHLTNCSSLREVEGLEELTSITCLNLLGCDSSMVANILTKSLFQIYSEFGNKMKFHVEKGDAPNWMSHSGQGCTEVPIDVSHNFLGLLLSLACHRNFVHGDLFDKYEFHRYTCTIIINKTTDVTISRGAVMIFLPRHELLDSCGGNNEDTIFKVKASCTEHNEGGVNIAVHPLYKLPKKSHAVALTKE